MLQCNLPIVLEYLVLVLAHLHTNASIRTNMNQHDCASMRPIYVSMRCLYVDMRFIYVNMRYVYIDMRFNNVDMR